jgi:hypothetical protein
MFNNNQNIVLKNNNPKIIINVSSNSKITSVYEILY